MFTHLWRNPRQHVPSLVCKNALLTGSQRWDPRIWPFFFLVATSWKAIGFGGTYGLRHRIVTSAPCNGCLGYVRKNPIKQAQTLQSCGVGIKNGLFPVGLSSLYTWLPFLKTFLLCNIFNIIAWTILTSLSLVCYHCYDIGLCMCYCFCRWYC